MEKYIKGILFGVIAGVINCLFFLFAKDLEITVFLSTFISWVAIGFLISSVNYKVNGIVKGMVVSFLVSSSSFVYTFASTIFGGIWSFFTTLLLGAALGYILEKTSRKRETYKKSKK